MNQMIAEKLIPLGSRILVRSIVPQKKTKHGILLPESHKEALKTARALFLGPTKTISSTGSISHQLTLHSPCQE